MYKWNLKVVATLFLAFLLTTGAFAQCSICAKTATQLGKASSEGLNSGIVYLMLAPFAIGGYIGFRWWRQERSATNDTES